ncbi:MAG: DUF3179 domain-containing protein [Litorimonas sp.]
MLKKSLLIATPLFFGGTLLASFLHTQNAKAQYVNKTLQAIEKQAQDKQSSTQQIYHLRKFDQDLLISTLFPLTRDEERELINNIQNSYSKAYIPPTLELYNFVQSPDVRRTLLSALKNETGQDFGTDINDWYRWLWNEDEIKIEGYDNFKSEFYAGIDPHFAKYFKDRSRSALIRLDEIRWGGVSQDGIPPLRGPEMIRAEQADYLEDDNIIFGIEVNGDVRAYPKRILAWHEMFVDTVGGVDFAGVYCTLCGTVILYETDAKGLSHKMGTSGFLYRSNKLMYDADTQSLWNTIKGEPVLGPLSGKDIALNHRSVVTTTWGKWKKLHPNTQVLSLNTGHNRDYGEGVAYHAYFSTDNLMFNTPYADQRLRNKQEVLALRFKNARHAPVAISADFLKKNPVYSGQIGEQKYVVLTDETGANRVYDPQGVSFKNFDGNRAAIDDQGREWKVAESMLTGPDGIELKRLPYHRAFWFGWHATYPNSKLIK